MSLPNRFPISLISKYKKMLYMWSGRASNSLHFTLFLGMLCIWLELRKHWKFAFFDFFTDTTFQWSGQISTRKSCCKTKLAQKQCHTVSYKCWKFDANPFCPNGDTFSLVHGGWRQFWLCRPKVTYFRVGVTRFGKSIPDS